MQNKPQPRPTAYEPLDAALVRAGAELNRVLFECGVLEYEAALLGPGSGAPEAYRSSLDRLRDAYGRVAGLESAGARLRVEAVEAGREALALQVQSASRGGRYAERREAHSAMKRLAPPADCVIDVKTLEAPPGPPGSPPAPPEPGERRSRKDRRSRVKSALRKRRAANAASVRGVTDSAA